MISWKFFGPGGSIRQLHQIVNFVFLTPVKRAQSPQKGFFRGLLIETQAVLIEGIKALESRLDGQIDTKNGPVLGP